VLTGGLDGKGEWGATNAKMINLETYPWTLHLHESPFIPAGRWSWFDHAVLKVHTSASLGRCNNPSNAKPAQRPLHSPLHAGVVRVVPGSCHCFAVGKSEVYATCLLGLGNNESRFFNWRRRRAKQ